MNTCENNVYCGELPSAIYPILSACDLFFKRHWPSDAGIPPRWNRPWNLVGSLPGHDSQGIYLLLDEEDQLLYIGVGASYGGGIYAGHGLGARIKNYVQVSKTEVGCYEPKGVWKERGMNRIVTLGLPPELAYLAYALEAFLIREVPTPHNRVRSSRTSNSSDQPTT